MLVDEKGLKLAAIEVAEIMRDSVDRAMDLGMVNRRSFHVVYGLRIPEPPYYRVVHETSYGDVPREDWEYAFDEIAHGKAVITGRTGLPTREVILHQKDLLLPGDVRYWGSWIEGIRIVAGSGWKSWHDEAHCKAACAHWVAYDEQAFFELDQAAEQADSNTI